MPASCFDGHYFWLEGAYCDQTCRRVAGKAALFSKLASSPNDRRMTASLDPVILAPQSLSSSSSCPQSPQSGPPAPCSGAPWQMTTLYLPAFMDPPSPLSTWQWVQDLQWQAPAVPRRCCAHLRACKRLQRWFLLRPNAFGDCYGYPCGYVEARSTERMGFPRFFVLISGSSERWSSGSVSTVSILAGGGLGFGLWAYLPESEEGLRGPRSAALGKLGSGAPHSPFGHAASGRGTRLLL